ncbi:MAG TPA: NUDIX hydrolase [Candidatus Acidoferrum sp.]
MKREYPETPIVGVGAVIIDSGRVALVKRGHDPFIGEWSIPGGALELGESVVDAVRREVLEETTLDVEPIALLNVYDRVILDNDERILYHYVLIDYLCKRISGDLRAGSDCDHARWFTAEEAAKLSLPADTAQVIRMGFEKAQN